MRKVQAVVEVDSANATLVGEQTTSKFKLYLKTHVKLPSHTTEQKMVNGVMEQVSIDKRYEAVITHENIPVAFDNITDNFNTLRIEENGSINLDITLDLGFYTTDDLASELSAELTTASVGNSNATYVVVFDAITSMFSITGSGGTLTDFKLIGASSNMANLLGFTQTADFSDISLVLTSPNKGYTNSLRYLKLKIKNISGGNHLNDEGLFSFTKRITIDKSRGEVLNGSSTSNMDIPIGIGPNDINYLDIELTDAQDNNVNMYNNHITFSLVIYQRNRDY